MDNLPDSVQQWSVSGARTDEVASYFLYVKTLDYQDKPNYQHLKDLLGSVVRGRLDFSMPQGPAGPSATKNPKNMEKKAARARGPPSAKPLPAEEDDEEHEEVKSKPVLAPYIRRPPITKPQSQPKDDVLPAVRRSLRPRSAHRYKEVDSEEEEEEDDARPKPIPACYLRGPPISPGAQPKQKAKSRASYRNTDDIEETSARQRLSLHKREHKRVNGDTKCRTQRERWDKKPFHHRAAYSQFFPVHSDSLGESERSVLKSPKQEAGSSFRHRLVSFSVFLAISLLFAAVLGLCQSTFEQ